MLCCVLRGVDNGTTRDPRYQVGPVPRRKAQSLIVVHFAFWVFGANRWRSMLSGYPRTDCRLLKCKTSFSNHRIPFQKLLRHLVTHDPGWMTSCPFVIFFGNAERTIMKNRTAAVLPIDSVVTNTTTNKILGLLQFISIPSSLF